MFQKYEESCKSHVCVLGNMSEAVLLSIFLANASKIYKFQDYRVVVRSDVECFKKSGKVAIICGGGSGHEPVFGGRKLSFFKLYYSIFDQILEHFGNFIFLALFVGDF